jgi:hypothetical protein
MTYSSLDNISIIHYARSYLWELYAQTILKGAPIRLPAGSSPVHLHVLNKLI